MTEEAQATPNVLECNGKVPPENVQVQVTDVIDEITGTAGTVPWEVQETEKCVQTTSTHEEGTDEAPQETNRGEDSSGTEPDSDVTSENAQASKVANQEEAEATQELGEHDLSNKKMEALRIRNPSNDDEFLSAETEEGHETDKAMEGAPTIACETENGEESGPYDEESEPEDSPPDSPNNFAPRSDTQKGHPSFGLKAEISKHAYSKYDTVSYRKIRRGNTKQRIDEFESMMNL
ncbi:ermin [Ambystoma mexicanum]|uniref:ermin n=1 Tax=Ambystoma mexicanum TaxID=8296 RepID=UPI0037E79820